MYKRYSIMHSVCYIKMMYKINNIMQRIMQNILFATQYTRHDIMNENINIISDVNKILHYCTEMRLLNINLLHNIESRSK